MLKVGNLSEDLAVLPIYAVSTFTMVIFASAIYLWRHHCLSAYTTRFVILEEVKTSYNYFTAGWSISGGIDL